MNATTFTVAVPCRMCDNLHELHPTWEGFIAWQNGDLIQTAMPELNAAERELLISGTCDDCWQSLFPPEEE